MKLFDLKIVIENIRGSYKKFADSYKEFPILGVTFPVHYGYIEGYESEDGHDLDVFLGNGDTHGIIRVNRDDVPGGIETKIILFVSEKEYIDIESAYKIIIYEMRKMDENEIVQYISKFKSSI